MSQLTIRDARALESCLAAGGVAVFPADTVYGLACDPDDAAAAARLYRLKGRPPAKPAAVMFFDRDAALRVIDDTGPAIAAAAAALLPGAVTLLVPNPRRRFAVAAGPDPGTLGLRVPSLPFALSALSSVRRPLLQTSANHSGGADARRLEEVPAPIRDGADLVIDGGELPGAPSTVIDLRPLAVGGRWAIAREGAVAARDVERVLDR